MENSDQRDRTKQLKKLARRIAEIWIFAMPLLGLTWFWVQRKMIVNNPCLSYAVVNMRSRPKYGTGYGYSFIDRSSQSYDGNAYILVWKGRNKFDIGDSYLVIYECDDPNNNRLLPVKYDTMEFLYDTLNGKDYINYPMY